MTENMAVTYDPCEISTHILAKRMTIYSIRDMRNWAFQLTSSRRGWRYASFWKPGSNRHFNSHPREEDDNVCTDSFQPFWFISTHILAKRMTVVISLSECSDIFQLTSSRRGWRGWNWWSSHGSDFNSHPREEDDDYIYGKAEIRFIFQLTSSRRGWR